MIDRPAPRTSCITGCLVPLAMACGVALAALAPWLVAGTGVAPLGTVVRALGIGAFVILFGGVILALRFLFPPLAPRLATLAERQERYGSARTSLVGTLVGSLIAFAATTVLTALGSLSVAGVLSLASVGAWAR